MQRSTRVLPFLAACLGLAASAACAMALPDLVPVAAFVAVVVMFAAALSAVSASNARRAPQPLHCRKRGRWLHVLGFRVERFAYGCRDLLGRWLTAANIRFGAALYVFQATVGSNIGFGNVGESFLAGPFRSQPAIINDPNAANLVVGRWFTLDATGAAQAGGAGAIGGVLINPKTYSNPGTTAGGALAPTLTVLNGTVGEFCYMGEIIVALAAAVAIGAPAKYTTATGVIGSGAPGAGEAAIPNSRFVRYANAAAGLAVLELSN